MIKLGLGRGQWGDWEGSSPGFLCAQGSVVRLEAGYRGQAGMRFLGKVQIVPGTNRRKWASQPLGQFLTC